MGTRIIAAAVPFFLLLMGLELAWNRRRGDSGYRLHDSIANLGCGIGQQLVGVLFAAALAGGYAYVYARFRLLSLPARSVWTWAGALVGGDFLYYWMHRASHRVGALWAAHVVHHQSEEYNLSVALRQSWLQQFAGIPFYLPLALLGFPPLVTGGALLIDTLYQFWIHTRAVGRLGPLEWVLNTPSHHRVHHGINPKYIDRNYAGILIVWDRLFGSFAAEEEEPAYGTVKPLASFGSVWANLSQWVAMARAAAATRRWRDKLKIWLAPPEWAPADLGGVYQIPQVSRHDQVRYEVDAPPRLDAYVALNWVAAVLATTWLLWEVPVLPRAEVVAGAVLILLTLSTWGALIERRRWAVGVESVRLGAVVAACAWACVRADWMLAGGLAAAAFVPALALAVTARPRRVAAVG